MTKARTLFLFCILFCQTVSAFMFLSSTHVFRPWSTTRSIVRGVQDDVMLYSDEWEDTSQKEEEEKVQQQNVPWKKNARWNSLSPKVKLRIMQEAQEEAIENKKKRESSQDKKRRMMMFFKKSQQEKKRASHIKREVAFFNRTPLSELKPGMQVSGKVISNTNFGSYVDIGTECDGLLHVSQMTRDFFVEHPRQVLAPGQNVTVTIRSTNPALKKLHLTMLPMITTEQDDDDDDDDELRIPLQDLSVDDELWGEITRVTAYGAYVELGAIVDGFLHFMDHPCFEGAQRPLDFMKVGDRIRVWVTNVDIDRLRIKLTANRPMHLPGPRRDIY